MKIVKVLSIALLAVAVSAGLTACMNDGGTTAPQQTTGFMPGDHRRAQRGHDGDAAARGL